MIERVIFNLLSELRRKIRFRYPFIIFKTFKFLESPRELIIRIAMEFVRDNRVAGDYLEFGVARGDSFSNAYHCAKLHQLNEMKFYAFDSFQGLPEIKGVDAEFKQFEKGQCSCSLEEFKENIHKMGVNLSEVTIVSGYYNEVLNESIKKKLGIRSAAVVYVDCDLYESTVPVLDFIKSYLTDGSILIFDDYFSFRGNPNRGERRAFRELLERNPEIKVTEWLKFGWHGNSFIVHPPLNTSR